MQPAFSLDQLVTLVAVDEEGSFSAAARRLGRVPSAVSYAIGQLEGSLGSQLFDRTSRRPVLTDAGRRLVAEARLVLTQVRELGECAAALRQTPEPQLHLAVDTMYPAAHLIRCCAAFHQAFPTTMLRIESGLVGEILASVRSGRAALGVSHLAGRSPAQLSVWYAGAIRLVPVCAEHHPLAGCEPPHSAALLQRHVQIVQAERLSNGTADQGVLASRTWRVTELSLKLELLLAGVGWGSLPRSLVDGHLEAGRLVCLQPHPWPPDGHALDLHAVALRDRPLGPAGQWLRDRLLLDPIAP